MPMVGALCVYSGRLQTPQNRVSEPDLPEVDPQVSRARACSSIVCSMLHHRCSFISCIYSVIIFSKLLCYRHCKGVCWCLLCGVLEEMLLCSWKDVLSGGTISTCSWAPETLPCCVLPCAKSQACPRPMCPGTYVLFDLGIHSYCVALYWTLCVELLVTWVSVVWSPIIDFMGPGTRS